MSDFLDRLTARAIGSETALAPRLPSLFESPRQVPIMPAGEQDEAPRHHRTAPLDGVAAAGAAPTSSILTATPSEQGRSRVAPAERVAVSTTPAAVSSRSLREASLPASTAPRHLPGIECPAAPASQARKPKADQPVPAQPRQTRVAPDRHGTMSPPTAGSLLPSSTQVFATQAPAASTPDRPGHVAMRPRLVARADSQREATRDPVVHVSIGRLEVRAAVAPVAPPRRHDAPRPSSLDDYLRQRGDKVTP